MNNYSWHPETFEYIGSTQSQLDPMETEIQGEDIFLCPTNATHDAPPSTGANEIAIWDVDLEQWEIVSDFRGQIYFERYGEQLEISIIGETVPVGPDYTLEPPPEDIRNPKLHYGAWVERYPMYQGADGKTHPCKVKADVDRHTRERIAIAGVGEGKVKTMKILAGEDECPEWDEWLTLRQTLLDEGNTFCADNFPS
jgi:hypothetical protein